MVAGMVPFSPEARRVLSLAQQEAVGLGHTKIGPGHLLLGLAQDEGLAGKVLREQGAELEAMREVVARHTPSAEQAGPRPGTVELLDTTKRVLERVIVLLRQRQGAAISCEHLLLAIIELEDERTHNILQEAGLDREKTRQRLS